jgi:hypothetical protein
MVAQDITTNHQLIIIIVKYLLRSSFSKSCLMKQPLQPNDKHNAAVFFCH